MRRRRLIMLMRFAIVLFALVAMITGITGCSRPSRIMLTKEKFPRKAKNAPIDVYIGRYPGDQIALAEINSVSMPEKDPVAKAWMVEDMRKQARKLGGDAIQDIRLLPREVRSFVTDENTPFRSWRQGKFYTYLLRGTVIRYEGRTLDVDKPVNYFDFKPPRDPDRRSASDEAWTDRIPEEHKTESAVETSDDLVEASYDVARENSNEKKMEVDE